jgi:hypothetical protein
MKAAFFSLILLSTLASASAFASTETVKVGTPYAASSKSSVEDAALCPQLTTAVIETKDGDLDATGLTLSSSSGALQFTPDGSSNSCMSDIICLTTDDFTSVDKSMSLRLTRNNNGLYPTTDLAGHSDMAISLSNAGKDLMCYYQLN